MGALAKLRRRRAIRSYARKLPSLLRRDYGAGRWFTELQVTHTVERAGLNRDHLPYALLMFSDQVAFERYCQQTGQQLNARMMCRDVAHANFYDKEEATRLPWPAPTPDALYDSHADSKESSHHLPDDTW